MPIRYNTHYTAAVVTAIATLVAILSPQAVAQQKAQQKQKADPNVACLSNLKQCAVGMMMYLQDNDEKFPPMQTAQHVQKRLRSYLRSDTTFTCPLSRMPYPPIKALSGKSVAGIKDARTTPMLFDAKPHPDGTEHTAYADGPVKRSKP